MNCKKIFDRIILLNYIVIILYVIFNKVLDNLLNPKQHIYVYICLVGLIIFFVIDFIKKNDEEEKLKRSDIIYLIPIILVLFINSGSLSSKSIINKNVNSNVVKSSTTSNTVKVTNNTQTNNDDNSKKVYITINDKNYIDKLNYITNNFESYIGKYIKVSGFIYKREDMDNKTFIISRKYMYCCAADTEVVGYLSYYSQAKDINSSDWYEITAIIEKGEYNGEQLPKLNVLSMKKIDKPTNEYVY